MKIKRIEIHNFRIYKGSNLVSFEPFNSNNTHIIAGKNGYGKTTFLTSLVWCFYGKLMAQVEEKYRIDIKKAGGYANYQESLINKGITESGNCFYVEIELCDLSIPSLPCEKIVIKRSYDIASKEEKLQILIDGIENELTKEVGYELFINDFILPREIAKFFFFDAEKIVSLAEANTKDELRSLSKAYSEVLGIKKYEDLRRNLESLLTKLNIDGVSKDDREKLKKLTENTEESKKLKDYNLEQQEDIKSEILELEFKSNSLQEKLIREGNAITLDELIHLKKRKKELQETSSHIKSKLEKLMEIVPLVIAGKKLTKLKEQLDNEKKQSSVSLEVLKDEISQFSNTIINTFLDAKISSKEELKKLINKAEKQVFSKSDKNIEDNILLDFSLASYRNFNALYLNIKTVFIEQFNSIVQEEKNNKILLSRTINKIRQAEARKDNHLAQKIRDQKSDVDAKIEVLNSKNRELLIELGMLNGKLDSDKAALSELLKRHSFLKTDEKKYKVTQKLLKKINLIISNIKEEKKFTLQKALKLSLHKLMHKANFIDNVKVNISENLMDIDLLDKRGKVINKNTLSKGEQQLYATALLKALVDESGIQFPVFIDSPLQKFDKIHSSNIINEFYPSISKQVVLLPLLEKELTQKEYQLLKPNLDKTFVIENISDIESNISSANIEEEFKNLKLENNVFTN